MSDSEHPVLRWLHLTDLHTGHSNESQMTALRSLVSSIPHFAGTRPFDLVLLTGDLAYSGRREEYAALKSLVIDPLRQTHLFANALFVATPGNHDLDCMVEYPPTWKGLGSSRQARFFNLGSDGKRTRGSRTQAFDAYQDFITTNRITSVDPTTEPASIHSITAKSKPIALVSAVTAFFSDKDVQDKRQCPAPVHPIRTLLQSRQDGSIVIVLGHHPPSWFTQETEQHLRTFLVQQNALYLHGHEHRIMPSFGPHGLTCLGFGAAYVASNESPPTPYYRNSYAICELTDSLHASFVSWDAEHGQWRSDQRVPGEFNERSDRLADGFCIPLPTTRISGTHRFSGIASALRPRLRIEQCLWLVADDTKRWLDLLSTLELLRGVTGRYALASQKLPAGHTQFRAKNQIGQHHLVYAISGHGDIFHFDQLESINTELDRQDYDGCIIVTLGAYSGEARSLATQLASRKNITVLDRDDVLRRCLENLPFELLAALQSAADPNLVTGTLIITDESFALLLQDRARSEWFQVVDGTGAVVRESSSLVASVRREMEALRQLTYRDHTVGGASFPTVREEQPFDRLEYLRKCNSYFDNVKYAPLSALGFRFRRASLSGIYVAASADVGETSKKTQLTRALSEFVESLALPKTQQQQLESQLRSQHGLTRTAEVGAARKAYQKYNNVVVLGDPGSGKTCFLQHEILAYCTPPSDGSWYSHHLPIYVTLAEAARLLDQNTSLLDVAATVSSRRGIELPRNIIDKAISDGRAAFFFDGLDEVGYIDKRIALMSEIDSLMRSSASRGNRFILASRPAAVQPVDIPDAFTFLHLRGLTETEIRTLAVRVLTARLGQGEDDDPSDEEAELVDRLVADTRNKPGIERIATNPLLLTLLVLIYANTGALSARRHLIYTQAIKTLVSVRGRETRERQIAEADLRTRLGALALAIFQKDIAEIPGRQEVASLLAPVVAAREDRSPTEVAENFIQEVAESTGLLAIHAKDDEESDALITFMHYSFLEYYAAAGLLAGDQANAITALAANPRWRDVTTLLFGMLSEQGDITLLLKGLLTGETPSEEISKYKTVLALDCANECDVPPEESQELLAAAVHATISTGAGRYCPDLRRKIAERIEPLLQGTSRSMERVLARGLRGDDPVSSAAFADLMALIGGGIALPSSLVSAFEDYLDNEDPVARATAMHAIERRPELRTEKSMDVLRKTLKGNLVEKHAALKVVAVMPLDESLREPTRELLDDPNSLISAAAAQCLLVDALRMRGSAPNSPLLDKVLSKLHEDSSENTGVVLQSVTLDRAMIYDLVFGDDPTESELAIRHVPLMKDDDPQFAYDVLMRRLRTTGLPTHRAACLDSLRESPRAINLITIADTDFICEQLQAPSRDVRMAAIRLTGEMPSDEQIVKALQEHLNGAVIKRSKELELAETAKALAKHVRGNSTIRFALLESVLERLPRRVEDGFGDEAHQRHVQLLLTVCESIGDTSNESAAWRLHKLATDYRTPYAIRDRAFRVFGRLVEPSSGSVDAFVSALKRDVGRLNDSHYTATASFISQCRRKVEYVRRVYSKLDELRDGLCKSWQREVARSPNSINPHNLNNIRDAIIGVSNLMVSYEEFSDRAKIAA